MPQSFRVVIFDLDGVLADSEPWWNEIDAKLLAQYGVRYRGEYHRNVLGVSYRRAAEKLNVAADACLVIEDALAGIAAAKAAKMCVAAIPDRRFVDPHEYEKEADYLLGSLSEIPSLIRRVARD